MKELRKQQNEEIKQGLKEIRGKVILHDEYCWLSSHMLVSLILKDKKGDFKL